MRILALPFALLLSFALTLPAGADTVTITFQTDSGGSYVLAVTNRQAWLPFGSLTAYGGTQTIVFDANVTATQSTGTVQGNPAFIAASITGVRSGSGTARLAGAVNATFSGSGWIAGSASIAAPAGFLAGPNAYVNWVANTNLTFSEPWLSHHRTGSSIVFSAPVFNVNSTGNAVLSGSLGGSVWPTATQWGSGARAYVGLVATEVSRTFYDANPVPEPGTALLLGLGLAGLAGAGWRRKRT